MRSFYLIAGGLGLLLLVGCKSAPTVKPENFQALHAGMSQAQVQVLLGEPASTGQSDDGVLTWEYREYRYNWNTGAREQVATYDVKFKDGKLKTWGKVGGPEFRRDPVAPTTNVYIKK